MSPFAVRSSIASPEMGHEAAFTPPINRGLPQFEGRSTGQIEDITMSGEAI